MQRDMELIREILLYLEQRQTFEEDELVQIDGYDHKVVIYHLILVAQAELIIYDADRSTSTPDRLIRVFPWGLSWHGHEFLEAIRDPEVWRRTKEGAQQIGNFGIDLITALAKGFVRKQVDKFTGVHIDF
jgi:hypothetical protein